MILDVGCGDFCRGDVCLDVGRTKDVHIVGDAHFLPFRDGLFDGIHAQCVIEHLSNPVLGLKEFMRVAKKGAKITIITDKPSLTNTCFSRLVKLLFDFPFSLYPPNVVYQLKSVWRLKREARWRHKSRISKAFMEKQAAKRGFEIKHFEEAEDFLFYSLYYFQRRGRFKKFFQYKPKLFHLLLFKLQKC